MYHSITVVFRTFYIGSHKILLLMSVLLGLKDGMFLNKKAHRWGAKLWVLAESNIGYTHQVSVYKGRINIERHPHGKG